MTLMEEFKSRNFSIYGQWTGILSIVLCIPLGISNIFHLHVVLAFSLICIACGLTLIFIEIPLLLRICPTSPKFDGFVRRFETNFMRAAIYGAMSAIQWVGFALRRTTLVVAAVTLFAAAVFYALAGVKGQGFVGSKTLGGHGVAQMIV